jgi:hypothetical protein
VFESYQYYSGQLTHNVKYPLNKVLAINNNNDEENAVNKRVLKARKRQSGLQD